MSELRQAAQAVVDRWDTPLWKDAPHTAEFIDRLRAALARSGQAASGSSQGARSDVQNGVGVGQPEAPTAALLTDELPAVAAWRAARKASIEAVEAYNAALVKARERDEIDGFGYTCVDREYQAMNDASNVAHRLIKPMLDALYAHPPARSDAGIEG